MQCLTLCFYITSSTNRRPLSPDDEFEQQMRVPRRRGVPRRLIAPRPVDAEEVHNEMFASL
jgi:hypothetical protein